MATELKAADVGFILEDSSCVDTDFSTLDLSPSRWKPLGSGTYGNVYKIAWPSTQYPDRHVAVKLPKNRTAVSEDEYATLVREFKIGQSFSSMYILPFYPQMSPPFARLKSTFDKVPVGIATFLCNTGSLADFQLHKTAGLGASSWLAVFTLRMATALKLMAQKGFCHSDVKSQNILLHCPRAPPQESDLVKFIYAQPKIADFGITVNLADRVDQFVGVTANTAAPEVLLQTAAQNMRGFTTSTQWEKVDVWSLGVVLYDMAVGKEGVLASYLKWAEAPISRANQFYSDPNVVMSWRRALKQALYTDEEGTQVRLPSAKVMFTQAVREKNPIVKFISSVWKPTAENAAYLAECLNGMLAWDASKRWTFDQVLSSKWVSLIGQQRSQTFDEYVPGERYLQTGRRQTALAAAQAKYEAKYPRRSSDNAAPAMSLFQRLLGYTFLGNKEQQTPPFSNDMDPMAVIRDGWYNMYRHGLGKDGDDDEGENDDFPTDAELAAAAAAESAVDPYGSVSLEVCYMFTGQYQLAHFLVRAERGYAELAGTLAFSAERNEVAKDAGELPWFVVDFNGTRSPVLVTTQEQMRKVAIEFIDMFGGSRLRVGLMWPSLLGAAVTSDQRRQVREAGFQRLHGVHLDLLESYPNAPNFRTYCTERAVAIKAEADCTEQWWRQALQAFKIPAMAVTESRALQDKWNVIYTAIGIEPLPAVAANFKRAVVWREQLFLTVVDPIIERIILEILKKM